MKQIFPAFPSKVESALMQTLYDLLGANEDDDAEALEKAFRKVIKAHHPDLHPDDPDAQARFREIVAAHAVLRDAEQRASYDFLLKLEREPFSTLAGQQLWSKLAPEQLQSKFMLTATVIAVIGALIAGYVLTTMPMTGNVEINKGRFAASTGAAVENQSAIVGTTAKENENSSAVIGAANADAVKSDHADGPIEPAGAILMQATKPAGQGGWYHEYDSKEVLNRATVPGPAASEANRGDTAAIAEQELARGPLSNNAPAYKALGIASYRSGDFPQAIASFNAAILADPDDAQAHHIRGNAWDEIGDFESALADYDAAIRIDPDNPSVFHDRAIMWQRKGELDRALTDLDRAIRFSFSNARTYCYRGLIWYEKGRHDRAIADFNNAIKLDPNTAAACIRRGLVLHPNSEFKLTFATVNQAIRVDPSIFDALRNTSLRP
ncbi:MAG: tetratricopeptide repeat protein [Bradyrhizobiaceae bacterium]|nr:tetratricopeptide repeat protein [Bradyrhizobiaceae bacterium]